MADSCAGCRFFRRAWTDATHGACHRTPPVVISGGNSFFPEVGEHDWCGEFSSTAPGPAIPVACRDALCSRPHTITDDGVRYHPHDYD